MAVFILSRRFCECGSSLHISCPQGEQALYLALWEQLHGSHEPVSADEAARIRMRSNERADKAARIRMRSNERAVR